MELKAPFKLAGITAALMLAEANVYAAVPQLPASVLPEQVTRQLSPQPSEVPQGVAPPEVKKDIKSPKPKLSAAAKKIKFKLKGVVLEGNTVFPTSELEKLYQKDIGKELTVEQLFEIVQNITNFYRNKGYIVSRAILPPQHVKKGLVKVRVIEGYIDKVHVTGSPHGSKCLVSGFGHRVRQCRPLRLDRLETYMLLVNEIPSTSVKSVLAPSKSAPGAADLNMATSNSRMTGYFSYDNYGTRYIGPQQMTGSLSFNGVFNSGDSLKFTMTKTPKGKEMTFQNINYNAPLGDEGVRYTAGFTRTGTHPLFVLRPTQTDGVNTNFYTNITYPYIRTRSSSLNFTGALNMMDSETTALDVKLYQDHLRNLDLGFTYNFADKYRGANLVAANFKQGLPILGYSSDYNPDTAETSRPGGRGDYTKIYMQMSRLQNITSRINLLGVARGQWAFNPLLSSEQFTFGGNPMGRGYDPAEIIGDKGLAGSLELRYDIAINYFVRTVQLYAFYDAGVIWNIKTASGTPEKNSATSTGFGARFTLTKYVSGNIMWTQPLTKKVAAEQLIGEGLRPRVFFSVVASF